MTNPASSAAPSRSRTIACWVITVILAAELAVGGVWDILRIEYVCETLDQRLGYPAYFSVILGVWNVPCAVALLVPRFPRLKEWDYAAAVFTCTGAVASHLAVADGAGALSPIIFAVVALASWSLRPSARRDLAPDPSSCILARPFASRQSTAWAKYGWASTVTMGRPRRTKEPS
jgi:DoxX-like family